MKVERRRVRATRRRTSEDDDHGTHGGVMTQAFDREFWEAHWQQTSASAPSHDPGPNPYLEREIAALVPSSALDAGCGEGAEAIWLAAHAWNVTAADISSSALSRAAERAAAAPITGHLQWVEADLSEWEPGVQFDLVMTHYAHPAIAQLAFYERIAAWVAPGGTLLIVGHLHSSRTPGHENLHPDEASVTAASVTGLIDATDWTVITADEPERTVTNREGRTVTLHDVVVRATRRASPAST
jgi:SAM-dependent methyltransferase